ncbi:Uncharacterised protein [Mycobacteroides abscessus subsp. abscessus]|nr:Uncharacterised protein [Mycobacteroides abscessus subsp. abscessus]
MQALPVAVDEGCAEVGHVVAVEEPGVGAASGELVVAQNANQQIPVGGESVDPGAGERGGQRAERLGAGGRPGDHLGQHGVIVVADHRAVAHAGVHPDPDVVGDLHRAQRSGLRQVALRGVLGVEPGLDRVAGDPRLAHLGRQWPTHRHQQLQAHEVEPGDEFGDRVLDLQPGVHLQEGERPVVIAAVRVEDELDRSGPDVTHGLCRRDRRRAHPGAQVVVDDGRGRLLDDLLVAALHRALPLEQRDNRAVHVGQQLDLNVAGTLHVPLEEHRAVRERRHRLARGRGHGSVEVVGRLDNPHAAPAATRARLDQQRVADLGAELAQLVGVQAGRVAARENRHARIGHHRLGRQLGTHRVDGIRRRADEHEPGVGAGPREAGVLRHEAVAGMHGVGAGEEGGGDHPVTVEVGLRRRGTR